MNEALEINQNGSLMDVAFTSPTDIAERVRHRRIESATSSDGELIFWFAPHTRSGINRIATAALWAHTKARARDVPLLRGNVVVTGRDGTNGDPTGLTRQQLNDIRAAAPHTREQRILDRRCGRELRRQRREASQRLDTAVFRP